VLLDRIIKFPDFSPITLKYFQAFRGAFYNRGGAIILRVRVQILLTASEASRKSLGLYLLYAHIFYDILG